MNRVILSKGSIDVMILNSETMTEFIKKLYLSLVSPDWDEITRFNGIPMVNYETGRYILSMAKEKYGEVATDQIWQSKGFYCNAEELIDFHIGIPDNFYTLKPLYDYTSRGIEEFFDENLYDEKQRIKKEM